jgi:hypothetical protein
MPSKVWDIVRFAGDCAERAPHICGRKISKIICLRERTGQKHFFVDVPRLLTFWGVVICGLDRLVPLINSGFDSTVDIAARDLPSLICDRGLRAIQRQQVGNVWETLRQSRDFVERIAIDRHL